jgi:hypothetical protein
MPWNTVAVAAPPSTMKIDHNDIPDDISTGVEEIVASLDATQRGVVPFDSVEARDLARAQIRAYCEARKAGRLTASIWAGFTAGEGKFTAKQTEESEHAALSLAFTPYVKKDKDNAGQA